jgi:hypothetical protein
MVTVDFDGFSGPLARLNGSSRSVPARPIDIALAAATVSGWAPGASPLRRLMRLTGIALEVLAHLSLRETVPPAAPERLRAVNNLELDATAKAELHQRLGVGLARVIARQPEVGVVDLYSLEALSREAAAPLIKPLDGTRRRPDFVGSTVTGDWVVLEAKGRSASGPLRRSRAGAIAQAKAIDLLDAAGRPIPLRMRAASVSRLGPKPVHTYFEDPEPSEGNRRRWQIDPDALLVHYYRPVRDVIELYGTDLRPVSGALSYRSLVLPGSDMSLAIHRDLLAADLEDPDDLRRRRSWIAEEAEEEQASSVQAGELDLSVGGDGFALLVPHLRTDLLDQPRIG